MTNEEKKEVARQFAYGGHLAHIAINKGTWQRADFERDDISKIETTIGKDTDAVIQQIMLERMGFSD